MDKPPPLGGLYMNCHVKRRLALKHKIAFEFAGMNLNATYFVSNKLGTIRGIHKVVQMPSLESLAQRCCPQLSLFIN